ncbi:PREDICTED: piggyBac transposable element-derived protein 4-like [Acropora digitifera]|uniref:piggyBac transposable element-derived protein 4-like n=1 Tax=Acropora digitifera TaxID=70779 RepID=UPI00077B204C|nr:PREDICTED: piggyBac transposable element-derived protein 4-like [Acropora digitifera]
MGLVNKPTIQSYWATENSTLTPFFISTMSRTRYQQILRYLHFVDNSTLTPRGQDGYNKLGKIQPLLNLILPKFQETYCPSRNLSVDETLVKFKGKLSWKQFIKDKPARFGLKLFTLADADNGYVLSYKVYTGKDNAAVACGLAKRVVLELAEPFFNKGYNIFMENYYTSVDLFEDLYTHGMQACGTCRTNRVGFPKDLTSKDSPIVKPLKRGDRIYRQKDKITCVTWQDRKLVCVLSSIPTNLATEDVERSVRDGGRWTRRQFQSALPIRQYNSYMGGFDLADRHTTTYARLMKGWT